MAKHEKKDSTHPGHNGFGKDESQEGYPIYPASEDIYQKYHKESDINPEDVTRMKEPVFNSRKTDSNELDFEDDVTGGDLDIPGSELDDTLEEIGCEDEENNYYSLGGDEHNNLEEYQGE